jgi:2'-5' RNA ligase
MTDAAIAAAQHAIVVPVDDPVAWIDEVRRRHDPMAALIPPHFTLVYPFEASLPPGALRAHMVQTLAGCPPFEVALAGVSGADGEYLRYDIKQGNDALIALHDRLYSGPLAGYLDITRSYQPHMTIGRIADAAAWRRVLDELAAAPPRTTVQVRRVVSYRRYPDGWRQIDSAVELGP